MAGQGKREYPAVADLRDEKTAARMRAEAKAEAARRKRRNLRIDDAGRIGIDLIDCVVDNPDAPGAKETVKRNQRADPVKMLLSRCVINTVHEAAARRALKAFEAAEIGGVGAMDYAKPKVDGGKLGDPMADHVLLAHHDLKDIAWICGPVGYLMLEQAIGHGEALSVISLRFGGGRSALGYVTYRLREALDSLVGHWRMEEARGKNLDLIRGSGDIVSGPSREWASDPRTGLMVDISRLRS